MYRQHEFWAREFCLCCLASLLIGTCFAQDDQKKDASQDQKTAQADQDAAKAQTGEQTPAADDSLTSLRQQWSDLNLKLDAKKAEFDVADNNTDRARIRDEYVELMNQANAVIGKLKVALLAQFNSGDTSQETIESIIGLMINDASFDRDAEVLEMGQKLIDAGVDAKYFQAAANADRLSISGKEIFEELLIRQQEAADDDLPRVKLTTSKGDIVLELFENQAPQTVGNFVSLVESNFYDGLKFHRVINNFMAQAGCPKGDGTGDPGYKIPCECYTDDMRRHFTGSLSMAKGEARDTGGSQFFITFTRTGHLDGLHTVFGRVIEGMDVVNSLQRTEGAEAQPGSIVPDTIIKAEVLRKRDHEYKPTKVGGG